LPDGLELLMLLLCLRWQRSSEGIEQQRQARPAALRLLWCL
jgi:hypothetical protein